MIELLLAITVDVIVGDPKNITHPVTLIARWISYYETCFRRWFREKWLFVGGCGLTILTVVGTYSLTAWIQSLAYAVSPFVGLIVTVWLLSTTLAYRSLKEASEAVLHLLQKDDLLGARERVGWIVGRETAHLDEHEISRACVETVSENTVDGLIAPLFYAAIGGLPLAMAYKAVNTLDSVVGYRNERYEQFGKASARLDDVANYLPARLGVCFVWLASAILRLNWRASIRVTRCDAAKHPSPNSGWMEASFAGALEITLGGWNRYHGVDSFRALMGEVNGPIGSITIRQCNRLMAWTYVLFCSAVLTVKGVIIFFG
ncbi:MAG: adenosylcobinamide-phosphate synthase CbiB [Bacilli bacterium]